MTAVALTGANGFLGWHTRAALHETGSSRSIALGDGFDLESAVASIDGASRLIHIAGVNRGSDSEVQDGNALFAAQVAEALARCENPPPVVVFANSTQASNGSTYGRAKREASGILRNVTERYGARFEDVLLPNLFGEHGRPFYNAVTATFSHLLSRGDQPIVEQDKELTLLHVQDAADRLIGAVNSDASTRLQVRESVSGLLLRLSNIATAYRHGDIPDIRTKFDRDLFNTYRSYTFPAQTPVVLERHADSRGSFFEVIRSHGGPGQSSFSTTEPGISRGDHFHRRKIERFTVLAGTATISLRKLFSTEVYEFQVTGEQPVAVDMPTMWTHKITNMGADTLYTSFWTNEVFNPSAPDTIPEPV
jgi:UDP-2-acetamido-2,6-beta-L-arabino-hexul-4-ose reductase